MNEAERETLMRVRDWLREHARYVDAAVREGYDSLPDALDSVLVEPAAPPADPTPYRAPRERGRTVMAHYAATYEGRVLAEAERADGDAPLCDLLADLAHYAAEMGFDFAQAVATAQKYVRIDANAGVDPED